MLLIGTMDSVVVVVVVVVVVFVVVIGKDNIPFIQGIYTCIPETNHVPKQYNVAAILSLLFMMPISLAPALALMYFYFSTFQSMCAVPNMAVFCSSLTSWFPRMVLTYFLNDFEMVPVAPIITGITLVLTFHIHCISIVLLLLLLLLTLSLPTTTIVAPPLNVIKWQMGFNSAA
jgi:hypothetical protein